MPSKLLIGTSGWSYEHWKNIFYPSKLKSTEWLKFFSQHFKTVEINNSFYRLPPRETFLKWYTASPNNFIFAVKVSRFITHIKRLRECQEPMQKFLDHSSALKEKEGPLLFQFPPSFKIDLARLENFLSILPSGKEYVFEFRHQTWFDKKIYDILEKNKIALCLADSPSFPCEFRITAPFTFVRMHGGKILYGSNYSEEELNQWAQRIKKFLREGIKVYVYFNNDAYGYAIFNALKLRQLL